MTSHKLRGSLSQIAWILIAALIVVGATWQIGNSASSQQSFERGEGRGEFEERGEGRGEGRGRGRGDVAEGFSLRGIAGFAESLIKMFVVISAVLLGQRGWGWLQSKRGNVS
ncbi:MAG: hypothetical protein ACPG8W_19325 [Candidatus Promineifilaceae bacterium]